MKNVWNTSNVKKVGHSFNVISDGILGREDYNIIFESAASAKGEIKRFIPKETAEAVNIYSDITFSGNFFRFLNNSGNGKQIFIRELETKLNLVQSDREKSMTYLSRIKEEIGKINRMVTKDETYKPYRYIG